MFYHIFCWDLITELLYTVIHLCSKVYNATSTQSEINLTAKELIFFTCSTAKDVQKREPISTQSVLHMEYRICMYQMLFHRELRFGSVSTIQRLLCYSIPPALFAARHDFPIPDYLFRSICLCNASPLLLLEKWERTPPLSFETFCMCKFKRTVQTKQFVIFVLLSRFTFPYFTFLYAFLITC